MTAEQRKTLDRFLVEDAELVRELRSLGAGAEDGATHLLAYAAERIRRLKAAIAVEHSKAREQRYWTERAAWENKRSAKPIVLFHEAPMPYVGPKY